ncbi:Guanine nucleotide-binding protein subunit gamma 2 [Morella rubra]|uniref:Guanine nucleotide-binding protein subunit gamma 2 n=1 Tax=Morella rubra TaxID=262757 RepID=A0A6A1VYN6_9ROSI|nr:Guanine nucleotide-binding protein subunit gamma 2 [Morella rubra]
MQSDRSESASPITSRVQSFTATDTRGKHRIQAELKRLEQEARFLELMNEALVTYAILYSLVLCKITNLIELPSTRIELMGSSMETHLRIDMWPISSALVRAMRLNRVEAVQLRLAPTGLATWERDREELEQLEKMEKASAASKEMLSNVETKPDPLLPVTNGPIIPFWDRWFEGPQESKGCRCWIL